MKNQKWLSPFYGLIAGVSMLPASPVFAQIIKGDEQPGNAGNIKDLRSGVTGIINTILGILGLVIVAFIIYAGIMIATAGGDETKVKKYYKIITYAAIGLVIIFLAYAIVSWVVTLGSGSGT